MHDNIIYERIIVLFDVFDALATENPYKKVWPLKDILDLISKEKEKK